MILIYDFYRKILLKEKLVYNVKYKKEKYLTRISNVRKNTKFKRSTKAISPVIATLLMIAIAVVASLVVYAWVTGYIGTQTGNVGKAIALPSFAIDPVTSDLHVYVQNVGQGTVKVSTVYINDVLMPFDADPNFADNQIPEGKTADLTVPGTFDENTKLTIKVTTTDGTFMTTVGTGSSSSTTNPTGNPTATPTSGPTASPTPPPNTMHVALIEMSVASRNNNNERGEAVVTIVDSSGNPVSGATVSSSWTHDGGYSGTDSDTTDSSGLASVHSNDENRYGTHTFAVTITDVVKTGWTYDSSANVETSDSITQT